MKIPLLIMSSMLFMTPTGVHAEEADLGCRAELAAYDNMGLYHSKVFKVLEVALGHREDHTLAGSYSFEIPGSDGFNRVDIGLEQNANRVLISWFHEAATKAAYMAPFVVLGTADSGKFEYFLEAPVEGGLLGYVQDEKGRATGTPWTWLRVGCDLVARPRTQK